MKTIETFWTNIRQNFRRLLATIAIIFFFLTLFLMKNENRGLFCFSSWVASVVFFMLYHHPLRLKTPTIKKINFPLVLIISMIFLLRFFVLLNTRSTFFHGDEAILSRSAVEVFTKAVKEGKWDIFGAASGPVSFFPSLWFYLQGGIIFLLGPSVPSARILAFLTDAGIAFLIYQITSLWFDQKIALMTTLIYSSLPIAIHFGMTGMQNIQSTFFLLATFYCLSKGLESKDVKASWVAAGGILCGTGMYFYLSSIINPFLSVAFLFIISLRHLTRFYKSAAIFVIGFVIAAAPFIFFSVTKYNFLFGRANTFNFWLKETEPVKLFLSQIGRFLKGIYWQPMNGGGEFYVQQPLLPSFLLMFFVLAGFITLMISNYPYSLVVLLIIFVSSLFGSVFTDTPPTPQRVIHIFPFISMTAAVGIFSITKLAGNFSKKNLQSHSLFFLTAIIAILNLRSLLTENLKLYRQRIGIEPLFVEFYKKSHFTYPVLIHIPIHMRDEIYFYSQGLISPLPVDETSLQEYSSSERNGPFLLLTDNQELILTLEQKKDFRIEEISWTNQNNYSLFLYP